MRFAGNSIPRFYVFGLFEKRALYLIPVIALLCQAQLLLYPFYALLEGLLVRIEINRLVFKLSRFTYVEKQSHCLLPII